MMTELSAQYAEQAARFATRREEHERVQDFSAQAARFATRRADHERVQANVEDTVARIGKECAAMAAEFLRWGLFDDALQVMLWGLDEQMEAAGIRRLEVAR